MGIALVSSAASALPATAAGDAGAQAIAGDAGFASIFALQVGDLGKLLLGEGSIKMEKNSFETVKQDDSDTPVDPAQILAGMLPLDQTPVAQRPVVTKGEETRDDSLGQERQTSAVTSGAAVLATSQETEKKIAPTALTPSASEASEAGKNLPILGDKRDEAANLATTSTDSEAGKNVNFAVTLSQHLAAPKVGDKNASTESVATHLRDAGWSQDFGSKIVWMAKNEQQSAQLNINPPQLGPVQISLNLSGDQVSAVFASPHAEVRQAIQDALPQLREMLAGAGIDLGQANVGSQFARQDNPQPHPDAPRGNGDNAILGGDFSPPTGTATTTVGKSGRGMVDLFA